MKLSFVKRALEAFVVLLAAGISAESHATPINPAISFTFLPNDLNAGQFSLGFTFTANTNITVNQLAIFDDGTNEGSIHGVGIYDAQGNLLTSTDITQGTGLNDFFDWASINPLSLAAGHQYYIAEAVGTSRYTFANFPFMMVNPDITYIASATTPTMSSVLAFPSFIQMQAFGYFGPNFSVAVPEPESLPMFAIGLGLIGAFYFGRKRSIAAHG